jgi:hypothetical protein
MKSIDESRLESDLSYRFEYLAEFIGFSEQDITNIHAAAPLLGPVVPALVDAVYGKLFAYDATKRHFVPRQSGYEGELPEDMNELTQDHEMIQFRKGHLAAYLKSLVTRPYDSKMVQYLDFVGQMHTPKSGSAQLNVPLVQMNALLGFVSDAIVDTILKLNLDRESEVGTLRAFNKLLWIQNDLVNRHYAVADA